MIQASFHYAVGMIGGGMLALLCCVMLKRGWRWIPALMTLGGLWAIVPELPRLLIEGQRLGVNAALIGQGLSKVLRQWGDLFFFHRTLHPSALTYAELAMLFIILLYNAALLVLLYSEQSQRDSVGNRAWQAHTTLMREKRRALRKARVDFRPKPSPTPVPQTPVSAVPITQLGRLPNRSSHLRQQA